MDPTVTEDYLKAVYNAAEWSDKPVGITALANRLGLSPSSTSEHVRKLTERGLLSHARYGTVELTEQGRRIALNTVRKHRLIETFLVDYLGYGWDEVHDEAEVLEHAVSDLFVERLANRLGSPGHDPHGDPIPGPDGALPTDDGQSLDAVTPGTPVRVVRVCDDDPELLRKLDELRITLDTRLTLQRPRDRRGTVTVSHDERITTLDAVAAQAIRVIACSA